MSSRFLVFVLLASAWSAPALAQTGAASQLADPRGPSTQEPRFDADFGSGSADASVPAPPGYGIGRPSAPGAGYDPAIGMRLRALDMSWRLLGSRGVDYVNGILSLVVGSAQIVLGGVLVEDGTYAQLAPILIGTGSVMVARAIIVDFILRPNPQPIALRYAAMPFATPEERLARVRFGEAELESLAEQSFILRMVDSGINIVGAAAMIGGYMALRDSSRDFDAFELLFFLAPAISTIMAVINLFSPSDTERRWDAYRQMRDRQEEIRTADRSSVQLYPGLAIDPRGTGGQATLTGVY